MEASTAAPATSPAQNDAPTVRPKWNGGKARPTPEADVNPVAALPVEAVIVTPELETETALPDAASEASAETGRKKWQPKKS